MMKFLTRKKDAEIAALKEELRGTTMLIVQADSCRDPGTVDEYRFQLLVTDAKAMTKKYGFFDYWT